MNIILIPAVLSTKQCHDYVGGSRIWAELIAKHAAIIKPFRTLKRGDSHYLRKTVDAALFAAEMEGTLVNADQDPDAETPAPVLVRKGSRFKPSDLSKV